MKKLLLKKRIQKRRKLIPKIRLRRKRRSSKKDNRKKEIKLRKNSLPALIITILLWSGLGFIIYFVDPHSVGAIPLFFAIISASLFFTFSILFANKRRGFITSSTFTVFLILRYLGIGNIINLLLMLGLGITIDFYFSRK